MIKRVLIALVLVLLTIGVIPIPVMAQIDTPDTLVINKAEVWRDYLEEDDQLYLFTYTIEYTVNPTEGDTSELFVCKLMNGAAELGSTVPYAFFDDGYDIGLIAIYFDAASAPAWNGAYTVKLQGNPTLTWAAGDPPVVETSSITWNDLGGVSSTGTALTLSFRIMASAFENDWAGTTDLIEDSPSGSKFTDQGEAYFTNIVTNLRVACPDLFSASMSTPDFGEDTYISDFYSGGDNAGYTTQGVLWSGQTFTATANYSVNGVAIKVLRTGLTPGNITASIRATAAGLPAGGDLAVGTYDGDTVTTYGNGEWIHIEFTTDTALTSGTVYSIVIRTLTGGAANYIDWRYDITGAYAGGQACNSVNSGVAWAALGGGAWDFMFIVTATFGQSSWYDKSLQNRLDGTIFDTTNVATAFGLSRTWFNGFIWMFVMLGVSIAVVRFTNSFRPAMLVFFILSPIGALVGFLPLLVAIGAAFLSGLGLIYVFFYRQTG